ncbi:MAG: hypothetical protein KC422_10830 [Trueperaceae bacterium]|nr:hypothetical protein [Trueperaceae bacterium]
MILLKDLPIILALFAFAFGSLGLLAAQFNRLQQAIPNLRRNSYLYLLSGLLLTLGILIKGYLEPQEPLNYELELLSEPADNFLSNLVITDDESAISVNIIPILTLKLSFIRVELISDPPQADVFVEGKLRGQTPLKLIIPKNQTVRYQVSAAPNPELGLRYESFSSSFKEVENKEISVWLNRITQ